MVGWGCCKFGPAFRNRHVPSKPSPLSFLFVFSFLYDPLSCTCSLFIRRRGRSEAAHIHIHMYKKKIRPNSTSFLSAEPERHDEGREKGTTERFLLPKAERQRGERKENRGHCVSLKC